jgi:hypothetical protein
MHLTSTLIADLLLGLELSPLGADSGNILGLPSAAQIHLLALPIFHENNTPKTVHHSIDYGETTKKEPARESKNSGEDQEPEVRLQEREVESNLQSTLA